ncbi:DUF4956 domain-containing protein [Paraoerskovia marina]|uniref:DUF4956 domain-containing protein n=1 Tax=Paraoerskovia marina TaxID=545619 RepID=UPI000492AA82|nr:DUF4956 domain-containing protein [Paraoerskovia marina]
MDQIILFTADIVAIAILTFGLYFPRHRRRDLVTAYVGLNVGVLAVAGALASSTVGAGLGLGLFGVLSIIRLRSSEIAQHEVAYYFAALALGLLGGLGASGTGLVLSVSLMALIVVAMAFADSPALLGRYRNEYVVIDRAIPDETGQTAYLENLLGGRVRSITVQRLDLVNDTTTVNVRYEVGAGRTSGRTETGTESRSAARVNAR